MPDETFSSPLVAVDDDPSDVTEVWTPFTYFANDWNAKVKVSTSYKTELTRSLHYNEQVYGRLLRPSRQIEFAIGAERGRYAFETMVFLARAGTSRNLTPLLSDAAMVTAVDGNSALFDTRWRRYFVGCRAVFIKPGVNGKAADFYLDVITAILDDRLTFAGPPPVANGWLVAPVMETEPLVDPGLKIETDDVAYLSLLAKEADFKSALPASDFTAWYAAVPKITLNPSDEELPFFWPTWEWRDGADWSHDGWARSYTSGNAEVYYRDPTERGPRWKGEQAVQVWNRQAFWTVLNFFDWCRGRGRKFVNAIPLTLPKPLSNVTGTVTMAALPALSDWRSLVWHLGVWHTGGLSVFDVVSVAAGAPGTHVLTLYPAPGATILNNNILEVRALQTCRLASDTLVEEWHNNQVAEIKLAWEQADDNPENVVADELIIHTAPVLTIPNLLACPAPGFPPPGGGDCCQKGDCFFDPAGYLTYSFQRTLTAGVTSCPNPYSINGTASFVSCGVYEDANYRFEWDEDEEKWIITYIGGGTDPRSTSAIGGGIKCLRCPVDEPAHTTLTETHDCDEMFYQARAYCAGDVDYIEVLETITVFNDCA